MEVNNNNLYEKLLEANIKSGHSFGELYGSLMRDIPNIFNYDDERFVYRIFAYVHDNNLDLSDEIWKPIPEYVGLYEISNKGRVKRLKTTTPYVHPKTNEITSREFPEHILSLEMTRLGYRMAHLCKNGKSKRFLVNRLVASAFIENENNYPCVNHKDECPWNNTVENLEWCSYTYNNTYNGATKRRHNTRSKNIKSGIVNLGTELICLNKKFEIIEIVPNAEQAHNINPNYESSGIRSAVRRNKMVTYKGNYWIQKWEYDYIKNISGDYCDKFLKHYLQKGNILNKNKQEQIKKIDEKWFEYKNEV